MEEGNQMKIASKAALGLILVSILFVGLLYTHNDIGITAAKIESDIRSSQKIQDDWITDGTVSNTIAAYISYPQDMTNHTFSIYVNRPGLSFGISFEVVEIFQELQVKLQSSR